MGFSHKDSEKLLAECHRRCCVCHRFCGVKMELDHIVQSADGGSDAIENAIAVCFECHAEIKLYNDRHPRGRKLRPGELRLHKQQWLAACKENPMMLVSNPTASDVGALNSLIDELEFNNVVASVTEKTLMGCPFEVRQFDKAIDEGLISILHPSIKEALYDCYHHLKRANQKLNRAVNAERSDRSAWAIYEAQPDVLKAPSLIKPTLELLLEFLSGNEAQSEADQG